MRVLKFGMKCRNNKYVFMRLIGSVCIGAVNIWTACIEKRIEKKDIEVPEPIMTEEELLEHIKGIHPEE